MTTLYREFPLKTPSVWPLFVSFVKANAAHFADRGEHLRLIVTSDEKKRTSQANRHYFGPVLTTISQQAWVDGRQFSKEAWHEMYARRFGVMEEMTLPTGEIIVRRKSTTEMSVGEFSNYTNLVMADAAQEFGVEFPI
jgi:hypothetical protein